MAVWIGGIARTLVLPLVKGQEKCGGSGKFGGHIDLIGIHGHMDQAPAELQQGLFVVPPGAILFLAVASCGLAGPGVLQFQGGKGKAVDKQHKVYGFTGVVQGVVDLSCGTEDIALKLLFDPKGGACHRRGIEQ